MAKKKKKKLRLKYGFKKFLVYFIVISCALIYSINEGIKTYKEIQYQKTYEYKILQIGYSKKETDALIKTFDNKKLDEILTLEYDETYYKFITQKYFLTKNIDEYLEYKKLHEKESYSKIIALVNTNAYQGWYNIERNSNINDKYNILVNKFYHLDDQYVRDDIESIDLSYSYAGQKASKIVIEEFLNMYNDIKSELGVRLMVNSSYRPYKDQEEIYNEYSRVSLKYADSYAARPGYSEHQTGLAIDITSLEHPSAKAFTESQEYEWLKNNSYKYGFILRYPEGKEDITGYNTESWHFRYIGKESAKIVHDEDITFDEYYAYYIEGKKNS